MPWVGWVWVDGEQYKDSIAARMRKENGKGSWMVYKGCDEEYAKQVTAEHKVFVTAGNGKRRLKWVKKHSHADNHYLDCEVYAMAAAEILGVRSLHLQQKEPIPMRGPKAEEGNQEEVWVQPEEDWLAGAN